MEILLIEDDPTTAMSIELMLRRIHLGVARSDLGEDGLRLALSRAYDLILLDLGLPDIGGLDVLSALRGAGVETPILVLTGGDDEIARRQSFAMGATGYLPKPFRAEGLLTCVQAIARRPAEAGKARGPRSAGIELDRAGQSASVNGQRLALSRREFQLLELLARQPGTTLPKEAAQAALYGRDGAPGQGRRIDALVCKLRRKLAEATGGERHIHTVWGRGYVFDTAERLRAA